ncbi:tryptophan 7-halogenase [Streptomyces sp. NPDC001985]|uniref:tryptophan 7-halogenase n=1 Tax=Streptomyces sp. NPDC001985 TaxID=3154406 RepID=UPI00331FE29C
MPSEEFDVVVVGGGPSGSTLSTLVAKKGHRVLLLEKETFPRYQIGESLLPATVHGICGLLGVADEVAKAGFTVKRGGTFRWGSNPEPWQFAFAVSPKMAGPTSHAYQVERMKFDQILLDNARFNGVEVRERCAVLRVIEENGRVTGVHYRDDEGRERTVHARYVVDSSGNTGRLHKAVGGTRAYSDFFRNLAVFGYFEGGKRLPEPNSGNILCAAFDSGWFWYIPLSPTLTSVGAVVNREWADRVQGDPEQALLGLIDDCDLIKDHLSEATRVTTGPYGQVRVRKDWSYINSSFWKPGMVLTGDAACFVDPVFSSGVHLATYGAMLAARSINSSLAGTVPEEQAFEEFERRYRKEYAVFYEFLISFYSLHVDEQSYFWQAKQVTAYPKSDLEAFVDLVGGVSSGERDLIEAGDRLASSSCELSRAVHGAGAATGGTGGSRGGLFHAPIVADVMREGAHVQARALLGEDAGPETADLDGGLVSSGDGLSWVLPNHG